MVIIEKQREIPVKDHADVLVIGAGPSGVGAAISAAREGVKTILIENSGDVGGIATIGLMSHWTGRTKGGIYEEILDMTKDCSEENEEFDRQLINPEKLKTGLLNMLIDAGVIIKLYTMACQPIMEGNKITGVICEGKSGRHAYTSKIVIDASGDGDIATRSGAPYYMGRESDGKMQPMTLMFKVAGVDTENAVFLGSFEDTYETPKGELQALAKKHLPFPAGHVLLYKTTLPGIVTCNMTNAIDVDGTNTDDLTKAVITCRNQMDKIVEFLREFVPGFEKAYIISSASLIGVRETRHFKGLSTITEEDILSARVFDDWVVTKSHFNFDIHNVSGSGLDETGVQRHFNQPKGYTIPYGCLVPQKIDNLLLAGRIISGTHKAHSNFRAMPICANIGQAAGIAASLCVKHEKKPCDLPVSLIQKRLLELGVSP